MNIDNINLTAFTGVAEAGSFNKAADAMLITSTALIKQINQLEGDLGLRLFNRSHRGLTLTRAGQSLYKDAKCIIGYCSDLYRVTAADPYPENYDDTADRAKQEKDDGIRPEIVVDITQEQMAGYDTVFFGERVIIGTSQGKAA